MYFIFPLAPLSHAAISACGTDTPSSCLGRASRSTYPALWTSTTAAFTNAFLAEPPYLHVAHTFVQMSSLCLFFYISLISDLLSLRSLCLSASWVFQYLARSFFWPLSCFSYSSVATRVEVLVVCWDLLWLVAYVT
ncbi:hypothetical protein DFH11DRAFT_422677 [Phellopilus nigrolimitatus]|nr:hypothetical protein DFH11DRAFT_422677 [Phellopilus nigrolimitatus]